MKTLEKSRQQMIEENLGLVHACANRFKGRGIEYDDLYQAGCMGLVKAVDAFDFSRGVRFSTYGVPVILGEIKRLFREGGSVKVSRSIKELGMKISREREALALALGREPAISEIAERLQITPQQVAEGLNATAPAISLTPGEDEGCQIELAVDPGEADIDTRICLRNAMQILNEEEKMLISLRYFSGKTQSECAKILRISQVQVSRKEKKILLLLRKEISP